MSELEKSLIIHCLERRLEKIVDTLKSLKLAYPKNDSFSLVHELVEVIVSDPKDMDKRFNEFIKKWGLDIAIT